MKRILIVDDAIEFGRFLKAAITTLDTTLEIKVVPSAEEALLEIRDKPVDLLVADIHLPGISGLEMVSRARKIYPELNVIVITGLKDEELESKAEMLQVAAFFRKPMHMDDFLSVCQQCLEIFPENLFEDQKSIGSDKSIEPAENLSVFMTDLQKRLNATGILLLDSIGNITVNAGDLTDLDLKHLPVHIQQNDIAASLSSMSDDSVSHSFGFFNGNSSDFLFVSLEEYSLLIVWQSPNLPFFTDVSFKQVLELQDQMVAHLASLGVLSRTSKDEVMVQDTMEEISDSGKEETAVIGDQDFEPEIVGTDFQNALNGEISNLKPGEIDSFWETAVESSSFEPTTPDALSYEQASKLGFTPQEESE